MSEIATWDILTKLNVDASHYIPVVGHKRIQLQSLFPAISTVGVGEAPYTAITNKNQINLKALTSATAGMLTIMTNIGGALEFTVLPTGIDLSACNNAASLFLSTVNLAADVGATVLPVANGGTDLATIPTGSLLYTSALDTVASLALTTNGQIPIGSAAGPAAAVPASADGSVTITTGPNSLDFVVAFPNITGLISNAQITSLATTKLTGTILDAQITSMAGSKITGSKVVPVDTLVALTRLDSKYSQVANNADTAENTLAAYTIPADTLAADGDAIEVEAWGFVANNANAKDVKLYIGGTAVINNTVTTNPNNLEFAMKMKVVRTGPGGSLCKGSMDFDGIAPERRSSKHPITWNVSNTLVFTAQNGVGNPNEITFEGWNVKIFR